MSDFSALAARLTGTLATRDQPGYADATQPFNTTIRHSPDAVVKPADENDVVETLHFARELDLPVRIHSTGHGAYFAYEEGILLDLSGLDSVSVDPEAKTATIGGGTRWAAVAAAAAVHGLAPITGTAPSVGAVGFLLGGGIGPLARAFGFGSDRILSARVVDGDGELYFASATEEAELLWALRGGKGGLGVVTEITVGLVDLPSLYGGALWFDIADADSVLPGWLEWTKTAPDDLTTSALIVRFPDIEPVPEVFRGRQLLSIRMGYPGETAEGERLAGPLRALGPVYLDQLRSLTSGEVALINDDQVEPGPSFGRGWMLSTADAEFASTLLSIVGGGTESPVMVVELRHLGGALAVADDTSAIGYRDFEYAFSAYGVPDPELFAEVLPAAFTRLETELAPWTSPHLSANWIWDTKDEAQIEATWPHELRDRLDEVRKAYDPHGILAFGPYE